MKLNVGNVVSLKVGMLKNNPGTKGVVFNNYPDFDDDSKVGAQIIFENGEYDGFSADDQDYYLEKLPTKTLKEHANYEFKNVMRVSQDFKNGFWDEILK